MKPARLLFALCPAAVLTACATTPPAPAPQDAFWQALSSHCGKAFAGRMVTDETPDADMRGAAMTMHVRECSASRIAVPFHVQRADGSWDRSRTWLITRTPSGLRLKHDHRHEDGKPDAMTLYGGDTAAPGSAAVQEFPVDAESVALFRAEGRTVSVTNVWRVEVTPAGSAQARFAYQLLRQPPNARNFRVEFDLTRPIPAPPAPWGHD
ncbi:hypothetical protein [Novosphingobium sp.]|uniref:hypothetical protein n=1 Tax=Novosphingobium sp. TaxID=1874826 RepID=UPI002732DAD7|nr:hypothetical protein [Novosphingobium sp.]MDP3906142.1 hypothetical protein [Novosphingobium sp.]